MLVAPAVRVQQKSTRQNHRYEPKQPAFPARMVYGLYALSLGTGVLAPIVRAPVEHHALGLSTGRPGPHDFTVRIALFVRSRMRAATRHVRRIPCPTLVTIAKRPSSSSRDVRKCGADLPDDTSGFFCASHHVAAILLICGEK